MNKFGVMTVDEFQDSIVAQHDDEYWQESGYVAIIKDGLAGITRYDHCSCFDTFADVCGGGISDYFEKGEPNFDWTGTVLEMVELAVLNLDPHMPDRKADPEDYDYDHLQGVYTQIREWARKEGYLDG